ncbi:MAG: hypothetical protein A2057_08285 [Ignavibacteria bacterium GWA2_35_9]|nr:MAG: hypothetical protein A2057_08285 [Ignavibacteria bacterium GWA2_35_9]
MKIILILIICSLILTSCYEDITDTVIPNQSPETGLSLYPDSSLGSQPSRLTVSWWGDDPDGLIIGYYFSWDGINWTFTKNNDSLFSLQIGAVDTTYIFRVSAVDNSGNGIFDNRILQNNIDYGPEPFVDANQNGIYENNETFYDIGLIDPTPAEINLPIKNSTPTISWSSLSFLPDTSFPVMTFGWNVEDIDGNETVQRIDIALNDTNNFISIDGAVRIATIRINDLDSENPLMDVLIEGNASNIAPEKLPGLKMNEDNIFYVRAVDVSGAASPFIRLPDEESSWFVKKPNGKLLVIDDYTSTDNAAGFYSDMMDSLDLNNDYDVYDFHTNEPPFLSITFLETIKLFRYSLWYADNNTSLDLAISSVQKYLDTGGKILFSIQFPQTVDLLSLQGFLPIVADSSNTRSSLSSGVKISAELTQAAYPELETTSSLFRVRSFYLEELGVIPIYYFPNSELNGYIGFSNSLKNLFFVGLPFHKLNGGNANVKILLQKILFQDFGLTP